MSAHPDALIQEWEAKVSEANDALGSARTALNKADSKSERDAIFREIAFWDAKRIAATSGLAARHQFLLREVTSR